MIRLRTAILMTLALACFGQSPASDPASQARLIQENNELSQSLGDAGQSMIDRVKAFERHIQKYPDSTQRATIERSLLALAMEMNDKERIILYGEKALAAGGGDDMKVLVVYSWSAKDPGTFYIFDLNKKSLKPLFPASPWIKPDQMADVFPINYKSRDGLMIHGYLTVPPGKPATLI